MKNVLNLLLISIFLFITSCTTVIEDGGDPQDIQTYDTEYTPVYMSRETLNNSVQVKPPQAIESAGKIYRTDTHLFINDLRKGVHIFLNTDLSNPQALAFIEVPGCVDMAVRGAYLYLDNAVDLVTINVFDPANPVFESRQQDVFPQGDLTTPPDGGQFTHDPSQGYIVKWIKN